MHHEDARAEAAILSAAEAYRLVEEAKEQRLRAEAAEREVERLKAAGRALLPYAHHGWCDSIASLPNHDCDCGLRGKVAVFLAPAQPPAPEQAACLSVLKCISPGHYRCDGCGLEYSVSTGTTLGLSLVPVAGEAEGAQLP